MAFKKRRSIVRYRPAKRRHHKAGFTIPLAVIAGLVPTAAAAYETGKTQGPVGAGKMVALKLTGYNAWTGKWYSNEMASGWVPILAGVMAHKLAGKLGVNRALARAGVPVVRI